MITIEVYETNTQAVNDLLKLIEIYRKIYGISSVCIKEKNNWTSRTNIEREDIWKN